MKNLYLLIATLLLPQIVNSNEEDDFDLESKWYPLGVYNYLGPVVISKDNMKWDNYIIEFTSLNKINNNTYVALVDVNDNNFIHSPLRSIGFTLKSGVGLKVYWCANNNDMSLEDDKRSCSISTYSNSE